MKRNERLSRGVARLRRATFAGMSVLAAGTLLGVAATSASADTGPTDEQLLSQCHKADLCKFTPTNLSQGMVGEVHPVGPTVVNCGGTTTRSWTWSETTGEQTQVNLSLSTTMQLLDILNGSASIAFGRTFEKSHTASETMTQTMAPFTMAWTTRATGMQVLSGDWELHFPSRFFGHYIWYDKGFQVKLEDPTRGYVEMHYRTLSNTEIQSHCPGEKPTANRTIFNGTRLWHGNYTNVQPFKWVYFRDHGVSSGDTTSG